MPNKEHQTFRLSPEAREILKGIAGDDTPRNLTAVIEELIYEQQRHRIAYGQQVQQATAGLISALRSGDERAIGGAQIRLAELLHSLPAATGIAKAILSSFDDKEAT